MIMGVVHWMVVFLLGSGYTYKVMLHRPGGGKHKVILLLPLLPLFLYLPWQPSSCHIRILFAMVFLWTAPCKLVLLCFNSPLDPLPWLSSSFSHFLVATFLPIHISSLSTLPPAARRSGYGGALVKLLLLVGIVNIHHSVYPGIPDLVLYLSYCCQFYLGFMLFLEGIAAMVSRGVSVRLCPQFNEPLRSAGLAEFWGRRWNLTVNSVLKATIYKPVLQKSLQSRGTDASKALAMLATFAMSALFHELIFVYLSQSQPTGETMAFFLLHGLATTAEVAIGKRWPATRGLPTWMCRSLTLAFLYATVSFFLIRPLRRSGIDVQALGDFLDLQSALFNFLGFTPSSNYLA